ncbi:hypothetical protein [Undibacterium terreum]|uniref:hypothetical protein n=1 Tax=Undibacterium terreum TaxID=1224302 RepID=UPI001E4FFCFD|nr:hypothetical protein [Undibacterium terreum]
MLRPSQSALEFSYWFENRINDFLVSNRPASSLNPAFDPLAQLSVDGVLRVIWALGIKKSSKDMPGAGTAKKALSIGEMEACLDRAIHRMAEVISHQSIEAIRPTFLLSALETMVEDGLSEFDRQFSSQLILVGKQRENPKASLLHLNPHSQIKLF